MSEESVLLENQFNDLYTQKSITVLLAVISDGEGRKSPVAMKLSEDDDVGMMLFSSGHESDFASHLEDALQDDNVNKAQPEPVSYKTLLETAKESNCILFDIKDKTGINSQEIDSQLITFSGYYRNKRTILQMDSSVPVIDERKMPVNAALVQTLIYNYPELGALWVAKVICEDDLNHRHSVLVCDDRFCDIQPSQELEKLAAASSYQLLNVTDFQCDELTQSVGSIIPIAIRNREGGASVLNLNQQASKVYYSLGKEYSPEKGDYFDYVKQKNIAKRQKTKRYLAIGIIAVICTMVFIAY